MGILDFAKGASRERLSATDVADAADMVAAQLPVSVYGAGESFAGTDGGTVINVPVQAQYIDFRVGKVVNKPDGSSPGTSDYTDERYYVVCQGAKPATTNPYEDRLDLYTNKNDYPDDYNLTVTNLPEWVAAGGTHTLPTDGTLEVLVYGWNDADGNYRYVMSVPAGASVRLQVNAITAAAGGKYTARLFAPPTANIPLTGDFTLGATGTAGTTDVLLLDLNEAGRDAHSHLLYVNQIVYGTLIHTNTNDQTQVYTTQTAPKSGDSLAVNVVTDGGTGGSASTTADFTYTVTAASNGQQLGTTIAVAFARDPNTLKVAGTKGIAHYSGATLILDYVDETDDVTSECETP